MRSANFVFALVFCSSISSAQTLIAHRGVHHTYHTEGLTNETCTAERIYPPTHDYFENTIESMRAAFEYGADWVELDIHPTSDDHIAVFHDWTVDCRTEGEGVTRSHSLVYLQSLDVGYGYTADNGATFPLRGKGVGLIPSLPEVLAAFPDRQFVINMKSSQTRDAEILSRFLLSIPISQRSLLLVYGGRDYMLEHIAEVPGVNVALPMTTIAGCYDSIFASDGKDLGQCSGNYLGAPLELAEKIPGWPEEFIDRVLSEGGLFAVWNVDSEEDLSRLGGAYKGVIWTENIEVIGPLIKGP